MSADKPSFSKGIRLYKLLKILRDPAIVDKVSAIKAASLASAEESTCNAVSCIDQELARRIATANDDAIREEVKRITDTLNREIERASPCGKFDVIERVELTSRQIESLRNAASEILRKGEGSAE